MSEAEVLELLNARTEFENWLIVQTNRDLTLRRELIDEPRPLYSRVLQVELPSELQIRVVQENRNHLYLVLPLLSLEAKEQAENSIIEQTTLDMPFLAGAFAAWLRYLRSPDEN